MSGLYYWNTRGVAGPQGIQGSAGPGVINWRGTWSGATAYVANDAVTLNGTSYICILGHTNQQPPNATYWNVLAEKGGVGATGATGQDGLDITWLGAWSSLTAYVVNDAVSLAGTSYICILGHTNQSPPNATYWNVVASKGDTGATGSIGMQGPEGVVWRGAWNNITSYAIDDAVARNGSSFICIQAHSNQEPPNPTFWDTLAAKGDTGATGATGSQGPAGTNGTSFTWESTWSGATTYQANDVVQFSGSSYICILGHTNQSPPNPTYWSLMAQKGDTGVTGRESGIKFTFDSDTTETDPGSGQYKFNFSVPAGINELYISTTDADGNSVASWLKSFDDSLSVIRGRLFIMKEGSTALWIVSITGALTDNGTWLSIPVSVIDSTGSITNDNAVRVWFAPSGDVGATFEQAGGRLTVVSGTPVPTTNQVDQATLYYTPYLHNRIVLHNGSAWQTVTFSETSIAVPSGTDANHDVFGYLSSGVLTLQTVAWTNDSTRATALVRQDGILSKSGDTAKRYLGTIRTAVTSGRVQDTEARRGVFNMYNRVARTLRRQDSTASWTYNSTAWRQANGSTTNQCDVIIGEAGPVVALEVLAAASMDAAGNQSYVAIGRDTVGNSGLAGTMKGTNIEEMFGKLTEAPAVGFHSYKWVERAGAGTMTVDNTSNELCGLMGKVEFM